jgi:hypothetical protein
MHTSESIDIPLTLLHNRRQGSFGKWNKPSVFPMEGVGRSASEIWVRIAEYSARKLSYESDILNGIFGVMHAFEARYPGFSHLWGIPTWSNGRIDFLHQQIHFLQGLLWAPTMPFEKAR